MKGDLCAFYSAQPKKLQYLDTAPLPNVPCSRLPLSGVLAFGLRSCRVGSLQPPRSVYKAVSRGR